MNLWDWIAENSTIAIIIFLVLTAMYLGLIEYIYYFEIEWAMWCLLILVSMYHIVSGIMSISKGETVGKTLGFNTVVWEKVVVRSEKPKTFWMVVLIRIIMGIFFLGFMFIYFLLK